MGHKGSDAEWEEHLCSACWTLGQEPLAAKKHVPWPGPVPGGRWQDKHSPEHPAGADMSPGTPLSCKIIKKEGNLATSRFHI